MGATRSIGPYEIIEKIGAGGMGTVYRARHGETGQIVALKVMRLDLAEDDSFLRRFHREATVASSVSSPNIVSVLETGQEEDTPYIAMELVEGESLASLMRRSGPLPLTQALDIAVQIAQGLYAAEQKGITHRDISPQNIMMTADGTAKIADFGIARLQSSGTLTGTGLFIGKPQYSAPETFDGRADTRSDVYSLGIVLFEMLSGKPPFVGPTPLATMDMHMRHTPPHLADLDVHVPATVEEILAKCLMKDPDGRFQTPRDLLFALMGALKSGDAAVLPIPLVPPVPALSDKARGGAGGRPPAPPVASPGGTNWLPFSLAGGAALTIVVAIIAAIFFLGGGGAEGGAGGVDPSETPSQTPRPSGPTITPKPTSTTGAQVPTPTPASPTPGAPDGDGDGVPDSSDNCANNTNSTQNDVDGDGKGDVCDTRDNRDSDRDGIQNWDDDCPDRPETLNGYNDTDGCDDSKPSNPSVDSDGDGVPDTSDNCPNNANPAQSDIDGDGQGDACDTSDNGDSDGDGIQNWEDGCPNEPEVVNEYLDNDGCPDSIPPSNLTVTPLDPYTLQLNWTDNSDNEDGFRILICVWPHGPGGPCSGLGPTGPNVVAYIVEDLNPGTEGCFSVSAWSNAYGSSDQSNYVCATTPTDSTTSSDYIPAAVGPQNYVGSSSSTGPPRLLINSLVYYSVNGSSETYLKGGQGDGTGDCYG